jgi:hypothetical protein
MTQQKSRLTNDNALQMNELILHVTDLNVQEKEKISAMAELELVHDNDGETQSVKTEPYHLFFTCPVQQDDIQWYLTQYHLWPSNTYLKKAIDIENQLMDWGYQLFNDVFPDLCDDILYDWSQAKTNKSFFTVRFGQSTSENYGALNIALSQPWHLMHDDDEYLMFHHNYPVVVRSQFSDIHTENWDIQAETPPVRILLINARPEDDARHTETNHRSMAKPLFSAVRLLGSHVSIHILNPPTFLELEKTLDAAKLSGKPFHVVHFDGHWDNHSETGEKGFCFENPDRIPDTLKRNVSIVEASKLATCMKSFEIPLVILGTCQHPETEMSQIISNMLQKGVSSVITIPYKLMPETIKQFFTYFYQSLIQGNRISQAVCSGQSAIALKIIEQEVFHDRAVDIIDWFVPSLMQKNDPRLFQYMERIEFALNENERSDKLPDPPANKFVNRSRELLYIERFLENDNWAVIQAKGGEGKTALAVETARWFLKTSRVDQIVYVQLNYSSTATSILYQIGKQVLTDIEFQQDEWKDFIDSIFRKFLKKRTFMICDNMEYTCPNYIDYMLTNDLQVIFDIQKLFYSLLDIPDTKILFTTREDLGVPFNDNANEFHLDPLDKTTAIKLIHAGMKEGGYQIRHAPLGRPDDDIDRLMKLVHYHPLCIINMVPTIHRRGIQLTIRKMSTLMHKISKDYPDPADCALAASFELILQRLSKASLQYIDNLAVFHDSVNKMIFSHMSGEISSIIGALMASLAPEDSDENDETSEQSDNEWLNNARQEMEEISSKPFLALKDELIEHGLAREYREQLLLYPGLSSYLETRLSKNQLPQFKREWARGMEAFIHFLNRRFSDDKYYCIQKTRMELPNIIAFISHCIHNKNPDDILEIIDLLSPIIDEIDYEQITKQFDMIRNKLMEYINKMNDD